MLDAEKVAEWRRLTGAATPGPWHLEGDGQKIGGWGGNLAICDGTEEGIVRAWGDDGWHANAAFIAAAREAVPALLDALTAAEARALAAESSAARLREVLRGVEYVDTSDGEYRPECPVCGAQGPMIASEARRDRSGFTETKVPAEPHKDGCALAAALASPLTLR